MMRVLPLGKSWADRGEGGTWQKLILEWASGKKVEEHGGLFSSVGIGKIFLHFPSEAHDLGLFFPIKFYQLPVEIFVHINE